MKVTNVLTLAMLCFATVGCSQKDRVEAITVTKAGVNKATPPADYLDIKNDATQTVLRITPNKKRIVTLYTEVDRQSVNPLIEQLKALDGSKEPIYMLINSPGGSVLDGAALISQMESMKSPVYTVCLRLCASMAAYIHQYGVKRYAVDRSLLMFHPASAGAQGQLDNMLSLLTTVRRYIGKMEAYAIRRSGIAPEKYNKLVAYELWIDAEDATNMGLNDAVVSINTPLEEEVPGLLGQNKRTVPFLLLPEVPFIEMKLNLGNK